MQTGGEIENKVTEVMWTDYLTVSSNAATTQYKAIGTTGNEIDAAFVIVNGVATTKLTQDSTAASGKFAYDPSTKALTFSGLSDGTEIMVCYTRRIQADVLENYSDKYSGKCQLYIDAMVEDKCANVYRMQFYIPKADFNGEFDFSFGDNQTVHSFEAEALAGASGCANSTGVSGMFWRYVVFGENTADAN